MASPTIGQSLFESPDTGGTPYTTAALTTAASGSSIFVAIACHTASVITSITDSKSNTYTVVDSINEANDSRKLYVYKAENVTGGSSHTFTATFSAGGIRSFGVVEVLGAASSSILDGAAVTKYTNTAGPYDNAITTTVADTLVIGWILTGQGTLGTYSVGGGFSIIRQGGPVEMAFASRAAATATSYDPAWTHSVPYNAQARLILAVKAPSGPTVSSVSTATPREGASLTITGTLFGASQGSGDVKINGVAQTVTSWSDTSIVVTVVLGTNKFGAAYTVVVRDTSLNSSNSYAGITGLLPANSGLSYVDIGTPNTTSAYRLTSTADLVSGDQVEYENKGSSVTVATDGTFTANAGIASFSARAWTTGSGYGASGVQLLINTGSLLMSNSHKNKRRRF